MPRHLDQDWSADRPAKQDVRDYLSHEKARQQEKRKADSKSRSEKQQKVRRQVDAEGFPLPTQAEIDHVRLVAAFVRFSLPSNFRMHLWFVQSFLDAFSYSNDHKKKNEVKRRCSVARELAFEGRSAQELAQKLDLSEPVAEVLWEYGHQAIPKSWPGSEDYSVPSDGLAEEDAELRSVSWFEKEDDTLQDDPLMNRQAGIAA